jgi:hypothetical protein
MTEPAKKRTWIFGATVGVFAGASICIHHNEPVLGLLPKFLIALINIVVTTFSTAQDLSSWYLAHHNGLTAHQAEFSDAHAIHPSIRYSA